MSMSPGLKSPCRGWLSLGVWSSACFSFGFGAITVELCTLVRSSRNALTSVMIWLMVVRKSSSSSLIVFWMRSASIVACR